jgi:hypothetical protein
MSSMVSSCGDFLSHIHHIERWFGVPQFVLVEPTATVFSSKVGFLSAVKRVRSPFQKQSFWSAQCLWSLAISVFHFPCLFRFQSWLQSHAKVYEASMQCYIGYSASSGTITNFDTAILPMCPPGYSHLSGLWDLFRSQLPLCAPEHTSVTARFTYAHQSGAPWPTPPAGSRYADTALECGTVVDPVE